jgi:hypothetical protein
MDSSSGRDSGNSGSDSAKHYTGTASEQHQRTPKASPSVPTVPNGQAVRDERPSPIPGSAVK